MKKLLVSIFALTAISAAIAAPVSMEDQSQLKPSVKCLSWLVTV